MCFKVLKITIAQINWYVVHAIYFRRKLDMLRLIFGWLCERAVKPLSKTERYETSVIVSLKSYRELKMF